MQRLEMQDSFWKDMLLDVKIRLSVQRDMNLLSQVPDF
jgi:hypothetical protein